MDLPPDYRPLDEDFWDLDRSTPPEALRRQQGWPSAWYVALWAFNIAAILLLAWLLLR
jgi:hypothetical protein